MSRGWASRAREAAHSATAVAQAQKTVNRPRAPPIADGVAGRNGRLRGAQAPARGSSSTAGSASARAG